ncbi:CotH kinase family protein [Polaribacter glomeratus]|uniref:LTD domain-containing protein n=1 Tax=Polaribacter glomeratus TaxID=102 RepID=A0A2S7WVD6_9FLAO|nr:CotH kinase family protein [Polaribacter glomeratus]PQJ81331.1 hypothetical protein BTO16_01490 [Polaribacter glomeratus]TXD64055.1 T9SS type A sorting domain-containing protein [Polaribacter glomeratus]
METSNFNKTLVLFYVIFIYNIFNTQSQNIAINEIMSSNKITISDEDGDFEDWIEIYNYGSIAINLEGFGLSDNESDPKKWIFPRVTIYPDQYLLIWASDKNRIIPNKPLHTNFKISSNGEKIIISDSSGNIINNCPSVVLQKDESYGRQINGTGNWSYFSSPTPNLSNNSQVDAEKLNPPTFSHVSGLYKNPFNLELLNDNTNATIVYTFDGSEPDINNLSGTSFQYKNIYPDDIGDPFGPFIDETYVSQIYNSSILIRDRSNDVDKVANKNSVQDDIYVPINPVRKTTIIKAKAFLNGKTSETVAKTYFIWKNGNPYTIPVVSIQLQENVLFDYYDGIYNAGIDFDTWREQNPSDKNSYKVQNNNYWRSGREWEFPASVEIFDSNSLNPVLNVNAGFRVHGNNSRGSILKSLRLYARSEYDNQNTFEHNLLKEKIPGSVFNSSNKRLLLRGDGSGGDVAFDVVFNKLMQPFYHGITRIQNVVHFINGEYWGLSAIRDRFDEYHFAYNFGLDKDNVLIVDCDKGRCELGEGEESDFISYEEMRDFILNNDMKVSENYNRAAELLDMESLIDELIIQIFSESRAHEWNFWKVRNPENNSYGDGKWRAITRDFEATLADDQNWLEEHALTTGKVDISIFGNLLENVDFKNQFIKRFADLSNSGFTKERFKNIVKETFDEVTPYLAEDINRSDERDEGFYSNSSKRNLLEWIEARPLRLQNQIKTFFNINNTYQFNLNISNKNGGFIKMNTISIKNTTAGVSQNPYPWTGLYYENIPIKLEAKPLSGFVFSHWSGDASGTNPVITMNPSKDANIIANFNKDSNTASHLIYFWLKDNRIPNDLSLEILNATYSRNGLNASLKYTSSLTGYPFSKTNENWRKASLERKNDPTNINYKAEANNNTLYTADIIRGLQIKQPFKFGELENTIELEFSTTNFDEIKVSLAIKSDGAANSLLIDYFDGDNWSNSNLSVNSSSVNSNYSLKQFDFSSVESANNNPNFKVRIRFNGNNMFEETGKTVVLNNISVEGKSTDSALNTKNVSLKSNLNIFPNPTKKNIRIVSEKTITRISIHNLIGQIIYNEKPNNQNQLINLKDYKSGVYFITIYTDNEKRTSKIIKN